MPANRVLFICCLLLGGKAQAQPAVLTELMRLQQSAGIPVMAVAVRYPGDDPRGFVAVVGDGGEMLDADLPLRWGSITKAFTAITALQVIPQIETPLRQLPGMQHHMPLWTNPWASSHPLNVLQLLELTGGLTDLSAMEFNQVRAHSLQAALALNPASRTLRWPPGLMHSYSNQAAGLTTAAIETISKIPFAQAMQTYAFRPLNMSSATLEPVPGLPGGFKSDGMTPIPYWHVLYPAFGALNASLNDMVKFADALRTPGKLPPPVREALFNPRTAAASRAGLKVGYAAGLYSRVRAGHIWHGHGGDADGYRSRIAVLPQHQRAYIVLINADNPGYLRQMEQVLESALTEDLAPSHEPAPIAVDPALAGTYYPATARFNIGDWSDGRLSTGELSADGDALFWRVGRRVTRLHAVSSGLYRRNRDPVATVAFTTVDGGVLLMSGELGNWVRLKAEACPDWIAAMPPPCDQ